MGWNPLWAWIYSDLDPQDAIKELIKCVLAPSWTEGSPYVDIRAGYLILSRQTEGWLASLPFQQPLGAFEGGLTGGRFGNSSVLGSRCSKADSYHYHFGCRCMKNLFLFYDLAGAGGSIQ